MKILPAFIVVFAFAGNSNAAPGHVDLIGYFRT
jgi:hypothetical protein